VVSGDAYGEDHHGCRRSTAQLDVCDDVGRAALDDPDHHGAKRRKPWRLSLSVSRNENVHATLGVARGASGVVSAQLVYGDGAAGHADKAGRSAIPLMSAGESAALRRLGRG
jgi:hypothetical protein